MTDFLHHESERRATLGDTLDVRRACLVVIHDVWCGYNPHSPVAAVYELRRGTRSELSGVGRLSTAIAGERVVDVNVSSSATTRFLMAMAKARVVEAPYVAMLDHTDDYPRIEIALHVDVRGIGGSSGLALLFTESQGEFHPPGEHASAVRCSPSPVKRSGGRWQRCGDLSNEQPSTGWLVVKKTERREPQAHSQHGP